MSSQEQSSPTPTVVGAITPEEATILEMADPENDKRVPDIFMKRHLGQMASGDLASYALVTTKDEKGDLTASHYVYLGKDDLGTVIESDRAAMLGLPEPKEAIESLDQHKLPRSSDFLPEPALRSPHAKQYYDLINEPEPDINLVLGALTASKEQQRDSELSLIFAPWEFKSETGNIQFSSEMLDNYVPDTAQVERYKATLTGEQPAVAAESANTRADTRIDKPSEEDINDSVDRLAIAEHDPVIKALIDKYSDSETAGIDRVKLIQTNADLRYELGSYLLRDKLKELRISDPHSIPADINSILNKPPRHMPTYNRFSKLKSDRYATLLALSMIDGTFQRTTPAFAIDTYDKGQVRNDGMHRRGAVVMLAKSNHDRQDLEKSLVTN